MLGNIRKNAKHPFIQALLGTIILVFIFFFGWSMRGGGSDSGPTEYITKVNGEPITPQEYRSAYNNLIELYSRITGQRLSAEQAKQLGVEKRALEQVIDQKLMLQEADRRGMKVSDEELAAAIQAQPAFQENGAFSKNRYMQLLGGAGISAEQFEASKRQELLMSKLESAIKATVSISEDDIMNEYVDRKSTVAADYAAFDPEKFMRQVSVTPDRLNEFYKAEGEKFRVEERRKARYFLFPAENYMSQIQIPEEEAKKEYNRAASSYAQTPKIRARHILIRTDREAPASVAAKAEAKINALREAIVKGQDFGAAAKANSEDPGSKESGGDLGFFTRNQMVPEFDRAAFALKVGEVSQPVRTQFGYHLIKVEEKTEEKQRSFEEAREDVLKALKREKALDLSYKDADNALMDIEQKKLDWEALAKKYPNKTTGLLTAKERDPSAPPVRGFMEALFEMPAGKMGQVIETPAGAMILTVVENRPAEVPPLSSIREEVEEKFRVVEAKKLAKEAAARFVAEASAKGWASALAGRGLDTGVTDTFSKKSGSVPPLGPNDEAVKAIFQKAETGRVVEQPFEFDEKFYVFRISAASRADVTMLALERDKISAEVLPKKQSDAVESFIKSMRDTAKLEGTTPDTIK